MLVPDSSYSNLEIHMFWKVPVEAKMEPPSQGLNRFSNPLVWACTLTLVLSGEFEYNSFSKDSVNPGVIVFPPTTSMFWYIFWRRSISQVLIPSKTCL
jgi:hypothetical protein